ncbi:MAG: hypothetical protein ACJA08_001407 [Cyclobacteriaceae bacterium]|jgi:hypothetical protein
MIKINFVALLIMLIGQVSLMAQGNLISEMAAQEDKLYADTKQVNQFFRRFNGEEDEQGNKYFEDNRLYRSRKIRTDFIPILFDLQSGIEKAAIEIFLDEVTDKKNPVFLDFHAVSWFAEVSTDFTYHNKKSSVILFMEIQQQNKGYEWVIADVLFDPFQRQFSKDTTETKPFLHPMSHELDFMNLRKAFEQKVNPESFTKDDFNPDYVTLFLYELKTGNLSFETVTNVKFHFFNIDGWYFELSKFNRPGMNSGWLITNLVSINADQKQQLESFIYGK